MFEVLKYHKEKLDGLAFGAEDYSLDIGCINTAENLLFAKIRIVEMARFLGIDAYDTIYPYVRDEIGFLKELKRTLSLGFDGKMIIHPNQLTVFNNHESFCLQDQIDIVTEYEKNMLAGKTISVINGRIYERTHIEKIKRVLSELERGNDD